MAKNFEVELDLDSELLDVELEVDYEEHAETFEYEDFEAMGVNPLRPTPARPGTEEKVLMLSARYAAGVPLWHDSDCYDHGPRESELMGSNSQGHQAPQPAIDLDD